MPLASLGPAPVRKILKWLKWDSVALEPHSNTSQEFRSLASVQAAANQRLLCVACTLHRKCRGKQAERPVQRVGQEEDHLTKRPGRNAEICAIPAGGLSRFRSKTDLSLLGISKPLRNTQLLCPTSPPSEAGRSTCPSTCEVHLRISTTRPEKNQERLSILLQSVITEPFRHDTSLNSQLFNIKLGERLVRGGSRALSSFR